MQGGNRLRQGVATVIDGLLQLGHSIPTLRHRVFELDRGLDVPPVVSNQLEDFLDGRVALTEGDVRSVLPLPVLGRGCA